LNSAIEYYSNLAYQAMLKEVNLTPKPGLVDCISNGAHSDMTLRHFHASAAAIAPYFAQFIRFGIDHPQIKDDHVLAHIRPIGIACEEAMFEATAGVNTHKGSIFSLGLVCVAIGRLTATGQPLSPRAICNSVAQFCIGMVERELKRGNDQLTAGQRLFIEHGFTGARGEAESGFRTVIETSLPVYLDVWRQHRCDEKALHQALLHLMSVNDDTNVVSRGGIVGLQWLQQRSQTLLQRGGIAADDYLDALSQFDHECIVKNISPGGSADLLILTWFFAQLTIQPFSHTV
jgi:triphosphoribosyl-dephospho-CoA synthase